MSSALRGLNVAEPWVCGAQVLCCSTASPEPATAQSSAAKNLASRNLWQSNTAALQVDAETRRDIVDIQSQLISAKLDVQRRAEVVRFQRRIHDRLLRHPRTERAAASVVLRSWAQSLPQVRGSPFP